MQASTVLVVIVLVLASEVSGHGRLLNPPSRATMWRLGWNTPKNYNDNQMFCGGFNKQQKAGGKCGVCGDPWNGPHENEAGGKYATGTIVKSYTQGQKVTITIEITANHLGWFEFRLCPVNDKNVAATHECLDRHLLSLADGSGSRYPIGSFHGKAYIDVLFPPNLTCTQCVLQWKYHAGNSWGVYPNGQRCVGCGAQEEFYGCSDIAIVPRDGDSKSPTEGTTPKPTTQPITTPEATTQPITTPEVTTQPITTPMPNTQPITTPEATTQPITTPEASTQPITSPEATLAPSSVTCSSSYVTSTDSSYKWCQAKCPSGLCKSVVVCV